jgi:hypothetical protein
MKFQGKNIVKSRVICEMELPYDLPPMIINERYFCTDRTKAGLIFGECGFRCSKYHWECSRIFPSGEIRIGNMDRFRLTFFKRQINEELERMRKEFLEIK